MTEPMTNARLAQLRANNEPRGDHASGLTADEVGELIDAVEQLQALPKLVVVAAAEEKISDEDRQRWQEAYSKMQGYAAPITHTKDENGNPVPQWPTGRS